MKYVLAFLAGMGCRDLIEAVLLYLSERGKGRGRNGWQAHRH